MPLAATFLDRLLPALGTILRSFVFPDLGLKIPTSILVGLLVCGVALIVMGSLSAALGRGRHWVVFAAAAAAGAAGWVLFRGRQEAATFFVVVQLLLAFVGGAAFVWGFLESPWVPGGLLLAVLFAAAGLVSAALLGTVLAVIASLLGIRSLLAKAEEWSPGRRGSRWNRRSAAGWVVALLSAGALEAGGLASWGATFKIAGMAAGVALLLTQRKRVAKVKSS
jgi:MFS family permease